MRRLGSKLGTKILIFSILSGSSAMVLAAGPVIPSAPQVDLNPTESECTTAKNRLWSQYSQQANLAGVTQDLGGVCTVELGFNTVAEFVSYVQSRTARGLDPTHEYVERGEAEKHVVKIFVSLEVTGEVLANPSIGVR